VTRLFLSFAAILAGLSVAAGAFASHALKNSLSQRALEIFETGSKYQMYHALLVIGLLVYRSEVSSTLLNTAGFAFIAGIVLFSGSLYALSLTGIKLLGLITPIGGVAFLIGWGCLAVAAWNLK